MENGTAKFRKYQIFQCFQVLKLYYIIEDDIEHSSDAPESNWLNNLDWTILVILLLVLFCVLHFLILSVGRFGEQKRTEISLQTLNYWNLKLQNLENTITYQNVFT